MLHLIDPKPDSGVQEAEYARLLGYPPHHVPEGRALELAQWAREWFTENGRPWIYARQSQSLELAGEHVKIDGAGFSSKQLRDQLDAAKAHTSVVVAVSAGPECEARARELWEEGKPDEYFFMEMYGAAVVEHLITAAGGRICAWAEQNGMAALPHFSPGYSGWDVSDQVGLWQLIREGADAGFATNLEVMDTGMLRPKKSLLAVIGITRHLDRMLGLRNMVPCENCSLPRCPYRRKPYRNFLPQVEDVRRLQAGQPEEQGTPGTSGLDHNARYTVNARALQKWTTERLRLKILHDSFIEVSFRYEGTTCSNLGTPLEFDYHVKLGPPEDGYRIVDAVPLPAPGDIGHTKQCEYLANAEPFMRAIAADKPLLGRPLSEVFAWERTYNPSGCYCDATRRAHKWGLVYEVTHYALVQREKEFVQQETMIKLCDLNTAAKEKLPPAFAEKSGIGSHYVDAFIKPMNTKLADGTRVGCKRKGLKITLVVGTKKGEGLMRRIQVSRDPVVMLQAALQEAAKAAGVELQITDTEILIAA